MFFIGNLTTGHIEFSICSETEPNVQQTSKENLFTYAEHKMEEMRLFPVGTHFALAALNGTAIVAYQEEAFCLLATVHEE
jgi:hypothetical protein